MNEDTGLETGPTHDDGVPQDSIEHLQERARAAVRAVQHALASLLHAEGRPDERETGLPGLWRERDLALQALGLAVLDCELEDVEEPEGSGDELGTPVVAGADERRSAEVAALAEEQPPPEEEGPTEQVEAAAVQIRMPAPPPDDAAVQRLTQHFAGTRKPQAAPAPPPVPQPWMVLADAKLPARPLDMAGAIRELGMLERELQRLQNSPGASRGLCCFTVGCLAARARVLQQEWCQPPVETRLQAVFSSLTRYVADAGLAYVVGLKREHEPPAGTWRAEVRERTARLHEAVYGVAPARQATGLSKPAPRPQKSQPPRKPRPSRKDRSSAVAPEVPAAVLAQTRGRRGLVIGGDNRANARSRIQGALELQSLDWEPGKKMRRVRATARRLENGRYDVVIVLQNFISHKVTNMVLPAVPSGDGVVCAFVARGYGVDGIVRALRETLEGGEE